MTQFLIIMFAIIAVLTALVTLFLWSLSRMYEKHGTDYDENMNKDD